MRPIKDHQEVIEQQPDSSPNVTKSRDVLLIPGDDEMVQHIRPINKLGPKDIFFSLDKRRRFQICTQEIMRNILLPGILLSQL